MRPGVSAGSNQVGASETCTPQVSVPFGSAAPAPPEAPSASTTAKARACERRCLICVFLFAGQRDADVGRGVGMPNKQADPGFAHPGTNAGYRGDLQNMCVDRPLMHELLDLVQDRFAPFLIEFGGLFAKQRIDVGIAAVDVG